MPDGVKRCSVKTGLPSQIRLSDCILCLPMSVSTVFTRVFPDFLGTFSCLLGISKYIHLCIRWYKWAKSSSKVFEVNSGLAT